MVLEYFGEDPTSSSASGACCDVCSSTAESVSDYQNEMQVIIKAVSEISGQGEKVNYPPSCTIVATSLIHFGGGGNMPHM